MFCSADVHTDLNAVSAVYPIDGMRREGILRQIAWSSTGLRMPSSVQDLESVRVEVEKVRPRNAMLLAVGCTCQKAKRVKLTVLR